VYPRRQNPKNHLQQFSCLGVPTLTITSIVSIASERKHQRIC
jgi:hypothetical protein